MPNLISRAALAVGLALALTGVPVAAAASQTAASEDPSAGRGLTFSADVTNPYFPLPPGRTLVYEGTKDDLPARDVLEVTDQVVEIDGVPCRVVLDRLYLRGKLAETTADYYTQDDRGAVHYFGEDTATFDGRGRMEAFGTDGTWHAGDLGAQPGIVMPATPRVGAHFRQELLAGHAEDHFRILDLDASVDVPLAHYDHVLRTKEWTPLEPEVIDNKFYVAGIGVVKEVAVQGPVEELDLIEIRDA